MSDHQDRTKNLPYRGEKSSAFAALKDLVQALDTGESSSVEVAIANARQVIARKP